MTKQRSANTILLPPPSFKVLGIALRTHFKIEILVKSGRKSFCCLVASTTRGAGDKQVSFMKDGRPTALGISSIHSLRLQGP